MRVCVATTPCNYCTVFSKVKTCVQYFQVRLSDPIELLKRLRQLRADASLVNILKDISSIMSSTAPLYSSYKLRTFSARILTSYTRNITSPVLLSVLQHLEKSLKLVFDNKVYQLYDVVCLRDCLEVSAPFHTRI